MQDKPLNHLKTEFSSYQPSKVPGRKLMTRAGVAAVLRQSESETLELLLIQRAKREGDPWSGDMAFPGGKMDQSDKNIHEATLREAWEETGLKNSHIQTLGRLSDQMTLTHSGVKPMAITPFVYELLAEPDWQPNYEVADIVWMPLSFFKDQSNRDSMDWKLGKLKKRVPCYWYGDYRVWGLTLRMIDELCKLAPENL